MPAMHTLATTETLEREYASDVLVLNERLTELELELENNSWVRMADRAERDFSRVGLREIARTARLAYLKNPLINRAVTVQAQYVFGQGLSITADHELVNDVLQDFIDDTGNQDAFTSQQAQMELDQQLTVDGNLFFVLFPNPTTGICKIRQIPFDEVDEIITNPDDRQDPWFYKRLWTEHALDFDSGVLGERQRTAYYPDWRYQPASKPATIGGHPVLWQSPVAHRRIGGLRDMLWGVPEIYPAIDWAIAYKGLLENDATRAKALTRIALTLVQKNSTPASRAKAQTLLGTTVGIQNGMAIETNPPATTGATMVLGEGNEYKAMNLSGATLPPDHARPLRLMVAAGTGLPETFFGDASVGNFATSKTLDRPTELKFVTRREIWRDFWLDLGAFLIDLSAKAPNGRLPSQTLKDAFGQNVLILGNDKATDEPISPRVSVTFPSILEHDKAAEIGAIITAYTANGQAASGLVDPKTITRMLLAVLDVDDIDEVMDLVYPPEDEGSDNETQDADTTQSTTEAAFMEAVRALTAKVRLLA
jgi:hypothetical protein